MLPESQSLFNKLIWFGKLALRAPVNRHDRIILAKFVFRKLPLSPRAKLKIRAYALKHFATFRNTHFSDPNSGWDRLTLGADPSGFLNAKTPPANERWLLIAEQRIPTPDRTSGSTRLFAIIDLLAKMGFKITFVSLADKSQYHWIFDSNKDFAPYESKLAELGIDVIYGQSEAEKYLAEEGYKYRYVFLSYPDVAHALLPTARAFAINAKVIFDTVDLHGLRFQREAELKNDKELAERADYYKKIEKISIACSDKVIAITDDERDNILSMVPGARVDVIPNIHTAEPQNAPFAQRAGLLFIGHYLHSPNQDAVMYFVREILPLIHKTLPGVKFTMLGSSITDEVRRLQSEFVDAVGYVEDPIPYFRSHRVFVSPLRYGAGMKGKIGQSLSLGLPLVTTSIGAEGMRLENGKTALIADDPRQFADAVVKLYKDEALWQSMAANGVRHIEDNFSYAAVRNALECVFDDLDADATGAQSSAA